MKASGEELGKPIDKTWYYKAAALEELGNHKEAHQSILKVSV